MNFLLDEFPKGDLVLDASVLINLLGCGGSSDVLTALQVQCVVEQRTLNEVKRHPVSGRCHENELARLQTLGLVRVHRMSNEEYDIYLGLISGTSADCLDDGESAAIAIASTQQLGIILDDRRARRIQARQHPELSVASSLRMFMVAGLRAGWPMERTRGFVHAARQVARMNVVRGEEALFSILES